MITHSRTDADVVEGRVRYNRSSEFVFQNEEEILIRLKRSRPRPSTTSASVIDLHVIVNTGCDLIFFRGKMSAKTTQLLEMERKNQHPPIGFKESYLPQEAVVLNQPSEYVSIKPASPPGLEHLSNTNRLTINQTVEPLEVFHGFEPANTYKVKNSAGEIIYLAREESTYCAKNTCGKLRKFDMCIVDTSSREVMQLKRPFACHLCFFPGCLQKMEVCAPADSIVGIVQQNWNPLFPSFSIKDSNDDVLLNVRGPFCCADLKFKVISSDGKVKLGEICRRRPAVVEDPPTDADDIVITFPLKIDACSKAALLAATFLIDVMYFDSSDTFRQQNAMDKMCQRCRNIF
ncbi:hypothetical protein FQR65_LT15036 [Abscondita terminalis]|nr:hypothetical protein FQR65_LT15036 [Abscondita terminalis]